MEAVFRKIAQDTTKFNLGDEDAWRELYEPLYEPLSPNVEIIRDERYGPAERNRLDVYIPKDEAADKPVLLYVHGGGFFSGDKAWSEKCYANIGNFFARHGIITVLANHQLVPHVQYPGGADDIQLVREWIYNNIFHEKFGKGSVNKVILLGHSSGGAHIASNLYAAGDPGRKSQNAVFPPVAGIMYFSVPFWFDRRKPLRQKTIRSYFGSDEEEVWGPKCALGLFRGLPDDSPLLDVNKYPVYLGSVKWEVPETADATIAFLNAYRERSKPAHSLPVVHILDKHNHISNILSIGTEDDSQSKMILDFIQSCLSNVARLEAESKSKI
ncbi:hypothetical protein P175DRAFT_0514389 [Aspergillus ochraceoroseus IBT 24754]|uniref:BD-FAE-like domain-containing protein n=3 Tax=Aspergillus subgen. Nidulantes TaxID=2720870 RepID=A0A0F8UMD9_9EURO|nr:uncharacterized protein P175DRAFT_0514389 [Aspergillus ochraceoroseus IBT 24754]KKK12046.1 hypothetical protein ARAM_001000 [Aspergillus rambellii]KKK21941.1 hypothetical protein AOCH_000174 [Aspergillus ochraceoroseus]PTU22282.1 hypothetical protein P175DRAFT_0514389 [Aspergillus ochraceoroseus IBT 24754]